MADAGAVEAAWAAYRSGDTATGIAQAEAVVLDQPRHGEAWYILALNLERAGRHGAADRCFQRAARAHVAPQSPPFRVSWRRFVSVVESVASGLPEELRSSLAEVSLVLADYPDPHQLDEDDEEEILGLFEGAPRSERQDAEASGMLTPRISLFRRAHEHACSSRQDFAAEVRGTLIHELGHYLGYGEDDLERLGWG